MNLHEGIDTCALCPRLCRPACPVVTGTGREASVPTLIAGAIVAADKGFVPSELAAQASTLCTDCGACEEHCHIHHPLPRLLREARARLLPAPAIEALRPIEGLGDVVVVQTDERPLAQAVSARLGVPVRVWHTGDALGVAAVEHDSWAQRAAELTTHAAGATILVAHGGVAHALQAAAVPFEWLHEHLAIEGLRGSCRASGPAGPTACCGGAGPLAEHHPDDAARLGRWWLDRGTGGPTADARCAAHLRQCGGDGDHLIHDVVDHLIGEPS